MSDEAVALRLLADGREEAQIVERGRPEPINQASYVAHGVLRLVLEAREQLLCVLRLAPDQLASRVEPEGQARERGAKAVVQISPQAPPLLLPAGHELLAGALQVGRQPHGVHGDLGLPGEVLKEHAVGGRELLTGRPRGDHQATDLLPLVDERPCVRFSLGGPVSRRGTETFSLLEQDSSVRQLERLGDRFGDRRQYSLGGEGRLKASSQARGHRVGVVRSPYIRRFTPRWSLLLSG